MYDVSGRSLGSYIKRERSETCGVQETDVKSKEK